MGGVHHSIAYLFYMWFGPILTHFFKMTKLYLVALARKQLLQFLEICSAA